MYIEKYWYNYIGGTDDSLTMVDYLYDKGRTELPLREIFADTGLDKLNWDFHTSLGLGYTDSKGGCHDFCYAIDMVTDLAALMLECSASGAFNLKDLFDGEDRELLVRITATPDEHDAMNKALADFVKDPLSYDLHEMVDDEDMQALARDCEEVRRELYESGGRSRTPRVNGAEGKDKMNTACSDGPEPEADRGQHMELMEQCRVWHEGGEFQKIIDALEAVPDGERTPETDSELARAYNNLADPGEAQGIQMLRRAAALLERHEEYFKGSHLWNFRMGYSYYSLGQEGRALTYFQKALEALPGDDDTEWFIENCERCITLPRFRKNFRERTKLGWETFAEQEAELRRIMEEDRNRERGEELVARMEDILHVAFDDISFEMGCGGEKCELILTPEGNKVKLFELVYFQRHASAEVLAHWNILVGRQPVENIGLRSGDWEVSGEDVRLWVEQLGEKSFGLCAYCEKLLPLFGDDEDRAWWMLATLTDQVLGEIPNMRYIDTFEVLDAPKEEAFILLSELPDKLKGMGMDLSTDPGAYLEGSYIGYRLEPNEDPDADWRLDTMVGSTNCPDLVNEYLNGENDYMDDLHADGVAAGFFCYPLDGFSGENRSQQIFDFRDKLEAALTEGAGEDCVTLTGGATGLYCGYVDFIAWDLSSVLNHARVFFEDSGLPWASFHVFRRDAGTVPLIPERAEGIKEEG